MWSSSAAEIACVANYRGKIGKKTFDPSEGGRREKKKQPKKQDKLNIQNNDANEFTCQWLKWM